MWFVFAIITTIAWGSADLFYKKGSDSDDLDSHLKIVVMVGLVMGLHGFIYMITKGISFDPFNLIKYFPVSFFYILSMTIGYVGLRYIELSISSPVQNSSGAVTAILLFAFFRDQLGFINIMGIIIITIGLYAIAHLDNKESERLRALEGIKADDKYTKSFKAIIFPLLYCLVDGIGTFIDSVYLDKLQLITEDDALLAYEFTFLIAGLIALIYLLFIKKEKFSPAKEKDRFFAACFETLGQFFYVFALAGNSIIVAPLISSYSIVSVILSRIFLKEKLTKAQYFVVLCVIFGIGLLGVEIP